MVKARFQSLPWDTAHFGFRVGRVVGTPNNQDELASLLEEAKAEGARLVYFLRTQPLPIEPEWLKTYGGARVSGYIRFGRDLDASAALRAPSDVSLEVFDGSDDHPDLLAMGVAAGWLSRFRVDRRLPAEKCDELYVLWTRRSLRRELADEVVVARQGSSFIGMVTFRGAEDRCEIGLACVADAARGRGIGKSLITYAHERMLLRKFRRCEVVTQIENQGACRLYLGVGYKIVEEGDHFHFFLDGTVACD